MGLHEMTQLALWDDLSRNIMFAKELSIAYRNSAEAQKSDVGELAKALKKSSDHCHDTLEEILRSFLLPDTSNKGNIGNTTSEHTTNNNMNWGDNSGPLFSTNLLFGSSTRGELSSFLTNDFPKETRRSLSRERRQGSRSSSCYAVSPKQTSENNGHLRMRSRSYERQFLNVPNHNIETKRLRYRSRSNSPSHQSQPVIHSFIRSIISTRNRSLSKSRKLPQPEQQNNSPTESFIQHLPIPLEKSRSRSITRKSKSRDRSPIKRQNHSPFKSGNYKSDSNKNRHSGSCRSNKCYRSKSTTTKNKYRKSCKSHSPFFHEECIELSSKSRSPPSPKRKYYRSPRSRSPRSPIRRRRRSRSPPRQYRPKNRKINKNGPRYTKQTFNNKSSSQGKSQKQKSPKQNETKPNDNSNTVVPPPPTVFPIPRPFFQQPPRNYQPNMMYFGQPGHMPPPPPPPPPQFAAPPRPPAPYFIPPPRPRMIPFPPYSEYNEECIGFTKICVLFYLCTRFRIELLQSLQLQ